MKLLACLSLSTLALLAPPQEPATTSDTVADVAVLEKLLKDALDPAAAKRAGERPMAGVGHAVDDPNQLYILTMLGKNSAGAVPHSRAFHLPGAGVFFAMDLELPALPRAESESAPQDDRREVDEWERARRSLAGEPESVNGPAEANDAAKDALTLAMRGYRAARFRLDEEEITRARDAALEVLARHGRRVRGLTSDETITVALHLSALSSGVAAQGMQSSNLLGALALYGADGRATNDLERWNGWLAGRAASAAPPVRLILQVRVADLETAAVSADPLASLRARAQVHRY